MIDGDQADIDARAESLEEATETITKLRAENERLQKALRTASDELKLTCVRLSNVALGPDDLKAMLDWAKVEPLALKETT